MANTAQLKKIYVEQIAPALEKQFNYSSKMQVPVLKKIVVNQGLGDATQQMKIRNKLLAVLLLIALVLTQMTSLAEDASSEPAAAFPAGNPGEVAAVILHTNDVHLGLQDNIGYDGLALYRKELEEIYDHVLLVDAGDAIQGGPIGVISKGAEIIKIMNRIGYDLAIPGNHEFDFGFEVLDDCSEQLDCGYICTNFCTTDGEPVFKPWRMLEAGEIKIAFLAAVTPDTFTKSNIRDILNETGEPMYDFLADETGERLREALDATGNETLLWNGAPILAAYHALSPGRTESAAVVWGKDLPYLQSVNADGDVLSPKAEQTLTLHKDAFLEAAKKLRGTNLQTTKRAPVGKCVTTDSGFVKRIRIGDRACSGAEVRDAFGLQSAFFTLKQTGDDFTFTVRGVGHGVGMSLNSADFMARQGSSHEEILAHFYPGATLAGKEDDK